MLSLSSLGNNFFSGDPDFDYRREGSIHLFCINAVCVGAIPEPVVITIKEGQVFVIKANFSSLFTYGCSSSF